MTPTTLPSNVTMAALAMFAALASNTWAAGGQYHSHGSPDESIAIGEPGQATKARRTVKISMSDDMRFKPARITVKQGETVRFVVKNIGQLKHEFVLGTQEELIEHAEAMKKHPEMEHADANMVTVAPGKTGEVIWRFTKTGEVAIGCLQPGHYDAGMKGAVKVAKATSKPHKPHNRSSMQSTQGK